MATTETGFSWPKLVAGLVVVAAAVAGWWVINRPPEQRAMSPEEFKEAFQKADAIDRENWEAMWKAAGKKPPK